jgi:hypothetical protein
MSCREADSRSKAVCSGFGTGFPKLALGKQLFGNAAELRYFEVQDGRVVHAALVAEVTHLGGTAQNAGHPATGSARMQKAHANGSQQGVVHLAQHGTDQLRARFGAQAFGSL